ncbi:unnamed protein product, partial [marine sediment metagenome]
MINITSNIARQQYQAEFERNMAALENVQIRELKPVLNRQYIRSAQAIQQGMLDINFAVDKDGDRLRELLFRHYRRIATVFGDKVFKAIEEAQKSIAAPEIKGPKDEFWGEINRWMTTQAGMKIRHIQKTTKKNIAAVIQKGMNEGESHRTIARNIRKNGRITTQQRAIKIARTETHTAAVRSVDAGIKATRVEMEKEWVASYDERTRVSHRAADKQKVAQDAKFIVGEIALDYPGDPSGPPATVINCRCVLLYHTVRATDKLKPYKPEVPAIPDWKDTKTLHDAEVGLTGLFKKAKAKNSVIAITEKHPEFKGEFRP